MKTIILPPRCDVRGMSDELLKWLFAVNEVLKTSIAAEQLMFQRALLVPGRGGCCYDCFVFFFNAIKNK